MAEFIKSDVIFFLGMAFYVSVLSFLNINQV
jgi:hypothetical protein